MISISQRLTQLLQVSSQRAFNFPQIPFSVNPTSVDSEYDYISSISKDLFEKHRQEMSKYWKQDQLFATGIAQELCVQLPMNNYVAGANIDSLGQLNFKIKDENYINGIKAISKAQSASTLEIDYYGDKQKHCILFPFSQIAEKPLLNTFRGANISETMARIQKTLGIDVLRVGVIQNSQPFHGIIYAYLKEMQNKTGKIDEGAINFQKLTEFIVSKKLFSHEEVAQFGYKQIQEMETLDPALKEIMEKLTDASIGNFQESFSKFTPENIKLIRGDKLESSTQQYLDALRKRGVLQSEGKYLLNYAHNKNITFVDPIGSLTREGFFVGLLRSLYIEDLVKEFHIASDIQDELLYKNIQSILNECGIDAKLNYYTHNNLFSEQSEKAQINTLQDLFTQMKQLNIVKYKQKYPDIMPNFIEEQGEIFLDQCLGWTRYLDHRKSRKTPYLMSVENVLEFFHSNEQLTNTRQLLLEMFDSYRIRKEGIAPISDLFLFENQNERFLVKILMYFPDSLHKSLLTNEFKPLIEYSELLVSTIHHMQKQNILKSFDLEDKLTERQIANRIVLLDTTNKILHKLFYIIGILNG
ncbi:hypothetical protein ABPG72_022340 [Tetrahymena utriculariae]